MLSSRTAFGCLAAILLASGGCKDSRESAAGTDLRRFAGAENDSLLGMGDIASLLIECDEACLVGRSQTGKEAFLTVNGIPPSGPGDEGASLNDCLRQAGFQEAADGTWRAPDPTGAQRVKMLGEAQKMLRSASDSFRCALANIGNIRTAGYQPYGYPGGLLSRSSHGRPRLYGRTWLMRTGNPMDVALSDGREGVAFFRCRPHPGEGLFLTRAGRLSIDGDGRLRAAGGIVESPVEPVPHEAVGLRIGAEGEVAWKDGQELWHPIGRLQLCVVADPRTLDGDGVTFTAPKGVELGEGVAPGQEGGPRLLPGAIEMPAVDAARERALMAAACRQRSLYARLAACLSAPEAGTASTDVPVKDPVVVSHPPGTPEGRGGNLVLFDDLPWVGAHMKAMGMAFEAAPDRLTVPLKDRGAVVDGLTAVLQGLRRRLATIRENIANADRARDAQGNPNPYQRKRLVIGARGQLIESLDPAEFRKVYKPGSADADEKGFVTLPNVHLEVEQADLRSATAEYWMVREALRQLAPNYVFPDPVPTPAPAKP